MVENFKKWLREQDMAEGKAWIPGTFDDKVVDLVGEFLCSRAEGVFDITEIREGVHDL